MTGRHRDWPGFINARTLEGLPTTAGKIRSRRLFRSDEPTGTAETVAGTLTRAGIRTVLDLRSSSETQRRPAVLACHPMYRVSPLVDATRDHERDPARERHLLDLYRGSLDRNGATIPGRSGPSRMRPRAACSCTAPRARTGPGS